MLNTNLNDETITVLLAIYNECNTQIEKTLLSIVSQSFLPVRVIMIDDCPGRRKDEDYANFRNLLGDINLTILKNRVNSGLAKCLNKALPLVDTRYWARIDVGDVNHRDRFLWQLEFMKSNVNCGLVGAQVVDISDDRKCSKFPVVPRTLKLASKFITTVAHPTYFARTELVKNVRYPEIALAQDFGYIKNLHKEKILVANINQIGLYYNNTASNNKRYKVCQNACLAFLVMGFYRYKFFRQLFSNKNSMDERCVYPFVLMLNLFAIAFKLIGRCILLRTKKI